MSDEMTTPKLATPSLKAVYLSNINLVEVGTNQDDYILDENGFPIYAEDGGVLLQE